MREIVVNRSELEACSKRIEEQLINLEQSIRSNSERLRVVESYMNSTLKNIRGNLPLSQTANWKEKLIIIVDMLSDIETVVEKMEDVTLKK